MVERAGLVAPDGPPVKPDGIGALVAAVDACDHVDYYSLGGLTNLAALLDRHPEFAERIHLIQMGVGLFLATASAARGNLSTETSW